MVYIAHIRFFICFIHIKESFYINEVSCGGLVCVFYTLKMLYKMAQWFEICSITLLEGNVMIEKLNNLEKYSRIELHLEMVIIKE